MIASIGAGVWWYWSSPAENIYYPEYSYQEDAPAAKFDLFSQPFEQPTILRALYQGNIALSGVKAILPAITPVQYQGNTLSSAGQITTKKIYVFSLAIELESMVTQEWAKTVFADVPVILREIIHSDLGQTAQNRMETDSDVLIAIMSKDLVDWGEYATKMGAVFIGGDMSKLNQQARATSQYVEAVGGYSKRDAGLLRDALYAGDLDGFRRIYDGLSRYVLGSDADH